VSHIATATPIAAPTLAHDGEGESYRERGQNLQLRGVIGEGTSACSSTAWAIGGAINCNGACYDRMKDNMNCGLCGRTCPFGASCTAGAFWSPNCP
jgi:Stigma-specific protein, Stig1